VAAAAAHDFNNELTVILSSVSASILALEPGHAASAHLKHLQDAAERCARKSSVLLSFSRRRGARVMAASLEKVIELD
jgi:C4-dicarboxylate-specific signal transduction histidine kinase